MRPILVSVSSFSVIFALNLDDRLYLAPSVRFSPDDKHKQLLETVIEFGLNRYQAKYIYQLNIKAQSVPLFPGRHLINELTLKVGK